MDSSSILSAIALAISSLGAMIAVVNHKRIKSKCCKHEISASIDIEDTSPAISIRIPDKPKIIIPETKSPV